MTILELQEYAKENGFDSLEFYFINLLGEVKNCKWLDAWFDLFQIEGSEGFIMVKQWLDIIGNEFEFQIKTK